MTQDSEKLSILSKRVRSEYGSISQKGASISYEPISGAGNPKKSKKVKRHVVSVIGLFKYGTGLDWLLILLGLFGSMLNGFARPLMAIVFGRMTDSFLDYGRSTGSSSFSDENTGHHDFKTHGSFKFNYTPASVDSSAGFGDFYGQIMYHYSVYYIYFGLLVIVASILQYLCWQYTCERQIHTIKKKFFKQVLRQDIAWFDAHKSGEFTSKLNDDIERIRDGIGSKLSLFLVSIAGFVGGYIVGFIESWELTSILIFIAPILIFSTYFKWTYASTSTAKEQENYAKISAVAEEIFSSIKTVWSLCGQKYEIERYQRLLEETSRLLRKKYLIQGFSFGLDNVILYCSYGIAYWYGAKLVLAGTITAGSIFIIFLSVIMGSMLLGNAMPNLNDISTAKGSAGTIYQIIERKPKIDPYAEHGQILEGPIYEIKFENVDFIYPTRPDVQVLYNFNLTMKGGESVALCGGSGSGKSTVVALLQRFYDPTSGQITVNGVDIRDLNVHWWRSQIGIVSQEAVLFSGTIRENISLGAPTASFDEIVRAAKKANAHSFIKVLPAGYDTLVGERGAQLSGGQKQRIAIARAVIGDPKLLLLDEATSALDTVNEQVVQRALDKARKGRLTLIVAHRLSTIKDADCICAMEKGHLIEMGKHYELVEKKGLYHKLITNQTFVEEQEKRGKEIEKIVDPDLPPETRKQSRISFSQASVSSGTILSYGTTKIAEVEGEIFELPPTSKILKWCWYGYDKFLLIGYIISACGLGFIMPIFAVIFASVAQSFSLPPMQILESAKFWAFMFLALGFANLICHFARIVCSDTLGEHVTRRLRIAAFNSILKQDQAWHDEEVHSPARLSTKLARDAPMIRAAAGQRSGLLICCIVTLFAGLGIAFYYGWILALGLSILLPLLLLAGRLEFRINSGRQLKQASEMEEVGRIATEAIANVRTVQSLGREKYFYDKFNAILDFSVKKNKRTAIVSSIAYAFTQSLLFFVYAAGFCLGAYLVSVGLTTPSDVYKVFFAMTMTAVQVGLLTTVYPDYSQAKLSAGLVFQVIEATSSIDNLSEDGASPELNGEISIEDVYFSYPTRRSVPVLSGLKVKVEAGKTLALVGESGCGKSTLIQLLMRFYDPESGVIRFDGHDIRTFNIMYLRSRIGYVGQEPVLFSGSIAYNITYGMNRQVTQDEIEEVAKQANIHEFIAALPRGYETLVGERGMLLSGGQKQRIAIARALIRKPVILLLDEATSALDAVNEKLVQEALDRAKEGRTCVVVAHRLSTIRNADSIAVVDKGKIAEIGTHDELIAKRGFYTRLIERQRVTGDSTDPSSAAESVEHV